jgi:hypothetical protein
MIHTRGVMFKEVSRRRRRDDVDAKVFSILENEDRGPGMQGHP